MDDIQRYHEQLLYPVVRVHGSGGGGSGTIIYSEPDPKDKDKYLSFVLTNHHVIESLIDRKEDWDALLKRKIEKEFTDFAKVEIFDYVKTSKVISSNAHRAEILAYDQQHDLAILKLDTPRKMQFVAKLVSQDKVKKLKVFEDVCVCGCSLLHDPIARFGKVSYVDEVIDQKSYIMIDCGMYFGNSGGACFLSETGELLGVPSRVAVKQLGFGYDVISWMGWASHPTRLYEFFDEQELKFLYDPADDYYAAMDRRKKKQKQALLELKAEMVRDSE